MDDDIVSPRPPEGEGPGKNRLQAEAEQSKNATTDKPPAGTDKTPATPQSLPQLEITGTNTPGSGARRQANPARSDRASVPTDTRTEAASPAVPADPLDRSIVEMDRALSRIPDADKQRVAAEVAEVQKQIERIGLRAAARNERPEFPRELMDRIERLDREINKMFEPLKAAIAENAQRQGHAVEAKSIKFTCAPVGYNGQYAMGQATLSFRAAPFLPTADGQPYDVNALGTTNHELMHRAQDGLIIRRFADQLRAKGKFSLEALMEMYEKKLGEPLDAKLAFYHSLDEPLTKEQARRADGLLKSFNAMQENKAELTRIELSINRVSTGLKYLKEVGVNNFIRDALGNNPATIRSYFGEPTPPDIERHLKAYKEGGLDQAAATRDFERAMHENNARLAQQYDDKYKSQPHEREAYAEGDRTTRRAGELSLSVRPAAGTPEIPDVHRRALEIAKSLKSAQSDLKIVDRTQVKQLLNSTLDAIDEGKTRWTEVDRASIVKLIEDYGRGDAAASRAVHSFLGIALPAEATAVPDARTGSGVDQPQSLKDLERQLEEPGRRAEVVARMLERGPLRETLKAKGMSDERARQLERDMLSENREVRERAMEEIGRHYRGKGGARGFASEVKGRLGALVMVAAVLLPFVFAEAAREDNDAPKATWR